MREFASLGSVAEVIRGVTFAGSDAYSAPVEGSLPILRAGNIRDELDIASDLVWVDQRLVSLDQRFRPGDVAVCMSSGSASLVGKSAVLNEPFDGSVGAFCAIVRPLPGLDPHFLGHYLRSPAYWSWRGRSARGVGIQNLRVSDLQILPIPLLPLDEQRRIAARLHKQLAAIGLVATVARARIDQMNNLAQGAIDAAIPITGAVAVGSILRTPMRTGLSRAASATANHRVLTLSSVRNGILDVDQNRPMDATDDEARANAVRPSMFYVVRGNGSLHMAGAGAMSPEWVNDVVLYPDLLIQVDPDPAALSVEYLALAWRARGVRRQVETRLRTSAGIHKINLANLSTVEVPTPPLTEQRQIAGRLREQLAEIDRAKAALQAQRAAIDALPAALLREVFGGVTPA